MSLKHRLLAEHYFIDPLSRGEGGASACLEFREEELVLPTRLNHQHTKSFPYTKIHSIVEIKRRFAHCLIVGAERALPVMIRRRDVADATSIGCIAAELRRQVSAGPAGLERIARIGQRELLLRRLLRPPWFVLGLAGLLVAIFWQVQVRSSPNPLADELRFGSFIPALVASGEIHRIVTAGFLHIGWVHLVANALHLIVFGWIVEAAIGIRRTALLVFAASVLGYCALYVQLLGSGVQFSLMTAVGSSAAVWGLYGATSILTTRNRNDFPVGFRSAVLLCLWALIASEFYGTLISRVLVLHLAGGLCGVLIAAWMTRNERGIPLSDSSKLTPMICLVSLVVVISGGVALRNDRLYGDSRFLAVIHEGLSAGIMSDLGINSSSWAIAVADVVPERSLNLSLGFVEALVDRDPKPAYRNTLATLHYRLGHVQQAVEIMQGVWRDDPNPWSAIQLARFYEADLRGRSTEPAGWDDELMSGPHRVDIQLAPAVSRAKIGFRVLPAEPDAVPATLHALVYEEGELRGFVDISMASKPIDMPCQFDASALEGHRFERITIRPVWYHRPDPSLTSYANSCTLYWLISGTMNIP